MSRTIIIGDIHGCYDELLDLLDACALRDDDLVVSVGDLIDRGPNPGDVIRWFRARPNSVVLMGNHERKHVRATFSYAQEVARRQLGEAYDDCVAWMRGLPYFYETPEVRVVHAGLIPGVPLAEQPEDILCGSVSGENKLRAAIPDGWWHERYDDPIPIVFGHHVVGDEPLVRPGRVYGLDTGACHGGRLTALIVPELRLVSVPARADHWMSVARAWQVPVLRARPWATMSWKKIEETIADREGDEGEDCASYLASLRRWVDAVRALHAAMLARVPEIVDSLRDAEGGLEAAMTAHPAKPLLFLSSRNRLTVDAITARCATPAATLDWAARLGLPLPLIAPP